MGVSFKRKRFWFIVLTIVFLYIGFTVYSNYKAFYSVLNRDISKGLKEIKTDFINNKNNDLIYIKKYPFIHNCRKELNIPVWTEDNEDIDEEEFKYGKIAPELTHSSRIIRGILIYFPIEKYKHFQEEFQWLYRSWIEMIQYEFTNWRTDLVVFLDYNEKLFSKKSFFFNQLNCSFTNKRRSPIDKPMCTLIDFKAVATRKYPPLNQTFKDPDEHYDLVLKRIDIFSDNLDNLLPFYHLISKNLKDYNYVDSILMAFEGYSYFKEAGFDVLMRSDMDVFLTPLLGQWAPRFCNDFYVGSGAYSNNFNSRRFKRIAFNIGLDYANKWNLGSTWISSPDQFRLVSYLTLFGMAYLYEEEFSPDERLQKLGTLGWPYWHYGVLLLYGQHVALNHLIATKTINLVHLHNLLDYPSGNEESIFSKLHIHVYHGDNIFSKFMFRMGRYNFTLLEGQNHTHIKYYSLKMALESRFTTLKQMYQNFLSTIQVKT